MKKLALLAVLAASLLMTLPNLSDAGPAAAQEEPELGNVFIVNPSVCLALTQNTACLAGYANSGLFTEGARLNYFGLLDTSDDGELTREEVNGFVPFSGNQLHDDDGALVIVVFVDDDDRVAFRADSGGFKVDPFSLPSNFICDVSDDDPVLENTLYADEDCDGDGEAGDDVIFAHFLADGDERGEGVIEVYNAENGDVIGDAPYDIVGEPDSVTAGPFETVLAGGLNPGDCRLPTSASGFLDAFGSAEKTIIFGAVTDEDDKAITGAWITWTSSDTDVLRIASGTSPTLDLGSFGVAAPNVVCGIEAGTATLTVKLDIGPALGASPLLVDPGADIETVEVEFTVLDVADSMTMATTPASIECNGTNTAEVSATVLQADGTPVVDGSSVEFSIVTLGTLAPKVATTAGGVAKTVVTPLSSDLAGATVLAKAFIGPASDPTSRNDDGVDNDNDTGLEPDGIDDDGDGDIDEPGDAIDEGDEFNVNNRIPNPDVIESSIIVACAGGTVPPPTAGTPGTGTGGGGGSGGVITGPDTGTGGQAAGTGSLPIWSALALFVGAMALVGARLAVRRIE